MKKILLIPIITLLFACSSNATLSVKDPLTYDVKIKDNAEFILVKEGTSVEEFNDTLKENLDINTNGDTYEIECVGEKYSSLSAEEFKKGKNTYDYEESLKETLDHDSFRPIGLYITFKKGNKSETDYKQIIIAVARDDEYNAISTTDAKTIEEAYRMMHGKTEQNATSYYDNLETDQYISNIRQK